MHSGDAVPPLAFSASDSTGTYNWSTAVASGLPTLRTTATSASPVGTYPVTVTQGTMTANGSYTFAYVAGVMNVIAPNQYGAKINNAPFHNDLTMMNVKTQTTTCGLVMGDGATDDTAAITCLIMGARIPPVAGVQSTYTRAPKQLYFPAGTYLLSGQLLYYGCCEYWKGAGPANTIFKLAPNTPAYASGQVPSGVISIPPSNSNQAFANNMEGFRIEIGPGNPEARCMDYAASNYSGISNIECVFDDSIGDSGFSMQTAYPGPGMLKNIAVYGGCDAELFIHAEYSMTLENITNENQSCFGVYSGQLEITVRNYLSYNNVAAWTSQGSSNVLMNAQLDGYGGAVTAILSGATSHQGTTYIRDIHVTGYTTSLIDIGAVPTVTLTGDISESWTGVVNCNFCGTPGALNLPINETPDPVDDPNPATHTLLGPDPNTWAASVAASTSTTVEVPVLHNYTAGVAVTTSDVNNTGVYSPASGSYAITITIPSTVNHFSCNGVQFNPSSSNLTLNILGSSADQPFVVDHCAGAFVTINQNSTRAVVVKHMSFIYSCSVAGDFYGEDVEPAGPTGPIHFCDGQHIWIRQFDQEVDGQEVFLSTTTGFVSLTDGIMTIDLATPATQITPGMPISFIQMGAGTPIGPLAFMNGTTATVLTNSGLTMTATAHGQQGQTVPNYAITKCSSASSVVTCTAPFSPMVIPTETIPLSGFTGNSVALNGLTATVTSTQTTSSTTFTATLSSSISDFTGTTAGLGLVTNWAPTLQTGGGIAFASIIPKVTCNSCTLWALNYKTEKQTNGGSFTNANVELLGGFQYPLRGSSPGNAVFILTDTNFFTTTQSFGGFQWPNWISDTRNGVTKTFANPQADSSTSAFLSNYSSKGTVPPLTLIRVQGMFLEGPFN